MTFLETLVNTIPIPIYYKDETGRYRGCNPAPVPGCGSADEAAPNMDGVTVPCRDGVVAPNAGNSAVPSRDCASVIDSPLSRHLDAEDAGLLREPGVRRGETDIQAADGTPHSVILHAGPSMKAPKGQIAGLVGVAGVRTPSGPRKSCAKPKRNIAASLKIPPLASSV